jgi:hypothetical protein
MLTFKSGEGVSSFDFTKRYVMWADLIVWENPSEWCNIVKSNGYGVVVEITNHDIIDDETFNELVDGFGISQDTITKNTDFIVIDEDEKVSVIDDGHASGDRNDTVLGEISVFYNDNDGYGVYLNGNECILVNEQDISDNTDIRIAVMNNDTNEIIWSANLSYN